MRFTEDLMKNRIFDLHELNFDFKVFDSAVEMREALREKNQPRCQAVLSINIRIPSFCGFRKASQLIAV